MKKTNEDFKVIKLCKIKQWVFVVDSESYQILKDVNFPLIRFHANMFPTVELACKGKNIKARMVDFKADILNPFLDKVGSAWQSKKFRKCNIDASTMVFDSSKELDASKVAIEKLEICLRRFFARWGFSFTINYSDLRGKSKLHVTYKFDSTKMPIISIQEDLTALPTIRFKLGHLRLNLQLGLKYLEIVIEELGGSTWLQIKTSRCLYSQIGSVTPMMNALISLVNKEPHNLELTND